MKKQYYLIIASCILFCVTAALVMTNRFEPVETVVYDGLEKWMGDTVTQVMKILSNFVAAYTVAGVTVLLLLIPRTRWSFGVPVAIAVAVSVGSNQVLKRLFSRERPALLNLVSENSFSFPSAHAMVGMALYFTLLLLIRRSVQKKWIVNTATVFLLLLILMIGISRIYLGVHYAGDVLAGWLLGFGIAVSADMLWQYWKEKLPARLSVK